MEKGKKNRGKNRHDNDDENDVAEKLKGLAVNDKDDQEETQAPLPSNTSKKQQKKKQAAKVSKVSDDENDDDEEEEEMEHQSGGKGATISKFGLLDVEDASDKGSDSEPEISSKAAQKRKNKKKGARQSEPPTNNTEEKKEVVEKPTKAQGKKDKKKADDEDFDAILAQFSTAAPNNAASVLPEKKDRKKKKGGKNADETDAPAETAAPVVETKEEKGIENRLMTQEEIGKLMDEMYGEDSDDDKKKAKKNKKTKQPKQRSEDTGKEEEREGENEVMAGIGSGKAKSGQTNKKTVPEKEPSSIAKEKVPTTKTEVKTTEKMEPAKENKQNIPDKKTGDVTPALEKSSEPSQAAKKPSEDKVDSEAAEPADAKGADDGGTEEGGKKSKKDKRKKKNEKEKEKKEEKETSEKKPSKLAQKILEQQKFLQQEQERLQKEEEERIRKEEEAEQEREEKVRIERERKEREKQKKKERIERQKAEGRYLTAKQKEDQRRAQQMLEILRQQGADLPAAAADGTSADAERPKKRVVYEVKKKKKLPTTTERQESDPALVTSPSTEKLETAATLIMDQEMEVEVEAKESSPEIQAEEQTTPEVADEDVKDAWDVSDDEEEETEKPTTKIATTEEAKPEKKEEEESEEEESSSEEESEESSDESESESDDEDERTPQEKAKEKALQRIKARKEEAERNRTLDVLRAPVVCVLGHVDTGKTKILDKLRRTNVQDGEAGGITQQIGATNVPQDTIREQTKMCKEFTKMPLRLPGLLIIDTPGHESFSNLRNRGSSLCDIAILVVDIMHGLEPQTKESIELLKSRKTPFVVALNKIDRLNEWQTSPHTDVQTTVNKQKNTTQLHFNDRVKQVILEFAELGLNVALYYNNKNVREYISMVPTSAHSGDGMGNLIALICELTQTLLAKHLMYSEDLQATVMEVKALPGLGTTIDVILVNGSIREGETIVVAGQEGPIVTQIRALLMPQPLRELRVKSAYEHHKEVRAAQGCKMVGKDLEKALAGLPLYVACQPDEVEVYKEELSQMLTDVLGSIKVQERGVFVQASTLGSMEALLVFLSTSKIPYAGINIGPVHRRDVMKASIMIEHDPQYAVILAFDVKVEREAQEMADSLGVKIFVADIIYHLFDRFTKYREEWMLQKREEFKHLAVFPCKLRILPTLVFNSRDPIVAGVSVEAGFLKEGTMLCIPSKEFIEIGRVGSIQINHKTIEKATKGQEVCIKIDPVPGEAPKMFGRHFDHTDLLVSKISRESIDTVKNYFREEMSKADWQLTVELKKTFGIL